MGENMEREIHKKLAGEPKEKTQTTIRLPTELKEILQKEADKKGISLNAYILLLIDIGHQYQHL